MSRRRKTKPVARQPLCCPSLEGCLDAKLFKALGDPTRLHILMNLARCCEPQNVGDVAECCSVDLSVVSRHLAVLREAFLVAAQRLHYRPHLAKVDRTTLVRGNVRLLQLRVQTPAVDVEGTLRMGGSGGCGYFVGKGRVAMHSPRATCSNQPSPPRICPPPTRCLAMTFSGTTNGRESSSTNRMPSRSFSFPVYECKTNHNEHLGGQTEDGSLRGFFVVASRALGLWVGGWRFRGVFDAGQISDLHVGRGVQNKARRVDGNVRF